MQVVLNLSNDIEAMLQGFNDKESFILQAIINELKREKSGADYTLETLLSTEQQGKKAWLIKQFEESRIQISQGETVRASPQMFEDIKVQGREKFLNAQ